MGPWRGRRFERRSGYRAGDRFGRRSAGGAPAGRAIVLAGGHGMRLRPYTAVIPKPLMPVGDRPVLDIVLRQLKLAGLEHVTIATGYLAELIEAFFGDGSALGLRIDYFREEQPLGTVGALAFVEDLDAPFIAMNGDVLTDLHFGELLRRHAASDAIATVAATMSRIDVPLGVIELDDRDHDRITGYVEKPSMHVRSSMGVYCFSPRVRAHIVPGERLDLPDLVLRLLERGEVVRCWKPDAYWLDIGRHQDHELAVREFERNRARFLPAEEPPPARAPGILAVGRRAAARRHPPVRTMVTGGAGFIGSHVVDALLAAGHSVSVVDSLVTGLAEHVDPRARLYELDVTGTDGLGGAFAAERPDVVLHLAGRCDVGRAVVAPAFDADANVRGTAAVLEAARTHGAQRVVVASTGGALYGDADQFPTPETAPLRPMSPYGASKAAAEGYCSLYARLHGLSTACLRLANVYGPRQALRGDVGVIGRFCAAVVDGDAAAVYGDGCQTRDYVYVADVVAAFLLAGRSRAVGAFNVGTGVETPVLELAERLGVPVVRERRRVATVQRSCLDPGLARAQLGWAPSTSLADGLQLTLRWARAGAAPSLRSAAPRLGGRVATGD